MTSMRSYDPQDLLAETDLNEVLEWLEAVTDAIDDEEYEPTDWEAEFLEDIVDRLGNVAARSELDDGEAQPLSGRQLVSLRGIYDKVMED